MKMRSQLIVLVFGYLFIANTACSEQLGGAKGNVQNILTGQPIVGANVIATTSTNIESEQPYKNMSTKTDKNGFFKVDGLRNKSYKIRIVKEGFLDAEEYVKIPIKSNVLIEKPIKLFPLPSEGPGIYAFSDKYIKLTRNVPLSMFEIKQPCCGFQSIIIDAKKLTNIPPVKPKYLIMYDVNDLGINKMYYLIGFTVKGNPNEDPEISGDKYTIGKLHHQFSETYGSIDLNTSKETAELYRDSNHPNDINFWGNFKCVFNLKNIKAYEVSAIPTGYYLLGPGNRYKHFFKKDMSSLILNYR